MENEFKKLQINNNRLLSIILNAKVGASEIILERQTDELTESTESILKLQDQKNLLLDQIQFETDRQNYLDMIESGNKYDHHKKSKKIKQLLLTTGQQEGLTHVQEKYEKEDIRYEKKLLSSIHKLKLNLFNLSNPKDQQILLLDRIDQYKLVQRLKIERYNNEKESNKRLFDLIEERDQIVESCLEMVDQIEANKNEIDQLREKRSQIMNTNRVMFHKTMDEINTSKQSFDEDLVKIQSYKKRLKAMGFILQSLIYESGVDWTEDSELNRFFETLDNSEDEKDNEEGEEVKELEELEEYRGSDEDESNEEEGEEDEEELEELEEYRGSDEEDESNEE